MFGGPSFPLFRVLGFQVGAHWSLLVAVVLLAATGGGWSGVLLGALVFASILAHELGHAVVARRRRVSILGIDLHLFGGVAKMAEPPRSPSDEIAIAIAGPLVSMGLGIGLGLLAWALPTSPAWVAWIAGVNLMLGLFNLLPALPMDGGRVFRALLAKRHGLVEGTNRAVKVARVVAIAIGIAGLFVDPWLIALAALIWWMGSAEKAQMQVHQKLWDHGFRHEHYDPWARYEKASRRQRRTSRGAAEPEVIQALPARRIVDRSHPAAVLAAMTGQPPPPSAVRHGTPTVSVKRDALGRTVVAYHW